MPRWMSWLILVFIGYALVKGNFGGASKDTNQTPATADTPARTYPQLAQLTDTERWKRELDPSYVGPSRWRDITLGEGEGAVCGQTLEVKITGISGKPDTPQSIKVGNAPYAVLDTLLVGIKPGGLREISVPAADIYTKKPPTGMATFTVERVAPKEKAEPAAP